MDFGRAFSFPFQDPDWFKKTAIVALVSIIPVIGQFVLLGWAFEVVRRLINRESDIPLPSLDFGGQLGKGFMLWLVSLIYAIPTIIFTLPMQLTPMIAAGMDDPEVGATIVAVISICCGGLSLIYSLLLLFVLPAAWGQYAARGEFGAAFRFGEVFGLVRKAPVAYLLVALGYLLSFSIIAPLGLIACVIGVFLTTAYAALVTAHLTGQAYLQGSSL